ncbi:MAG TPA: SLBB domain-containing protein [bacterium]|nr:SLBB domain-containing protein [bacterium]
MGSEKYRIFSIATIAFISLIISFSRCGAQTAESAAKNVKVGLGDRIAVRIPIEPQFSGEFTIDEQGKFYLPITKEGLDLGPFKVLGMTLDEISSLIKDRMSKYYNDSQVEVSFVSLGARPGQTVAVFGALNVSGQYRYYESMTLLDLLLTTNGFNENADITRAALYRKDSAVKYLDLRGIIDGTDMKNNIELQPGDYLIVPRIAAFKKIKVVLLGKVARPGTMVVPEGTQILDLLAQAGGAFGRAAVGNTYIIRRVNGEAIVIRSDIKALINKADLKENIMIEDNDIVFVPETSRMDLSKVISDLSQLDVLRTRIFESDSWKNN